MNPPAAIKATFSDFRIVKTRKLAQFVFELPIEQADAALATLGGLPRSDNERWVGIARLDMDAAKAPLPHPRERREFCTLPYVEQAGIKAKDKDFQYFMDEASDEEDCASRIRAACNVASRTNIVPGTAAEKIWLQLLRDFDGYR